METIQSLTGLTTAGVAGYAATVIGGALLLLGGFVVLVIKASG